MHADRREPGGIQPLGERFRINRVVGITGVERLGALAEHAVGGNEVSARLHHPGQLGKGTVLVGDIRNVMQHVE